MDYDALRGMVEAIEDNNRINDAKWSDWYDANAAADLYEIDIDDDVAGIINRAIKSNGATIVADLRAAELAELGQNFAGGGHWITIIEQAHAAASSRQPRSPDFSYADHGSIGVLTPLSKAARQWVDEHIAQNDETQYWGGGIVIEPRYWEPIREGITAEGYTIS